MVSGTLFTLPSPRSFIIEAIVKAYKLDVKISDKSTSEFEANFPLKKYPAFLGEDGFVLTETIAIAYYLLNKADPALLGEGDEDYASVLKFVSFASSDLTTAFIAAVGAFAGYIPYNKKQQETAVETLTNFVETVYEPLLTKQTYLVGERVTLADLITVNHLAKAFNYVFAAEFRKRFPATTRWFNTVIAQPVLKTVHADFAHIEEVVKFVPPKKEEKPKKAAEKKEEKPKAAPAEEPAEAPKPKHPLELLGKPKTPLDEWKRVYSNEDTREKALPWFWEHYDAEEWSLWKCQFKYNDELTLTFMSNNLIGGFFNRLSASVKYMFGCSVVYGENNNNGIVGAFLVRGQDYAPAFDVAPDWESYEFTKLDASKSEDKEFIENMWAWDKPYNGQEIADGKVLK
ncbi:putative translation elongation factor 1-gamma [Nadsonia fulvescens var. elongata DSM 6958]|uniref:Putative translation elongation factor 1-gamma n=1 Tax=Nadsonia fulvescens var. elongata DSM 6958 TaxID=857566 RepID=A0A1E3PPK5_9ASCO|nr:putative translation elongation factor 1-gamma [Nadsonia fulvescens var. elongata DSM 6958]